MKWRWHKGAATVLEDFSDPTTTTEYLLCVYDSTEGEPVRVVELRVPPSGLWRPFARGFKFRDRTAAFAGVTRIKLKRGDDDKANVTLRGSGANLNLPAALSSEEHFDQDPSVFAQFVNVETGSCWTTEFSEHKKNSPGRYEAVFR